MASGFGTLEIARSGMSTNERALQTTSHNISNVNTKGYSRQRVEMQTAANERRGNWQIGLGSAVGQTRQIRDEFLDTLYRMESTTLGNWEVKAKTYKDIETTLGEPMWEGLQYVSTQFWDAWTELSKDPSGLAVRSLAKQRSEAVANYLNGIGNEFYSMQDRLDLEISTQVSKINNLTKKIADLNLEIMKSEIGGDIANDYRDQRNNALDELSKYTNYETFQENDGQLDVYITGYNVVLKNKNFELIAESATESGTFNSVRVEYAQEHIEFLNGSMKGLMDSRGIVKGAFDSVTNGTPNDKADIDFVVDVSNSSGTYLTDIKSSISTYVDELKKRGIDFNLRLITYKGTGVASDLNYGDDENAFISAVRGLTTDVTEMENKFEGVADVICDTSKYRNGVNKYAMVFTAESPSGNENPADFAAIKNKFKDTGIELLVACPPAYRDAGAPIVDEVQGWSEITDATGGKVFDITASDIRDTLKESISFINDDINEKISNIEMGTDIIPFVLKKINAYANILFREANYIHQQGRTFGGDKDGVGKPLFVKINENRPFQVGNIRVNSNLDEVNNICASATDSPGDNTIAFQLTKLRDKMLFSDKKGTMPIGEYYQSFISELGAASAETNRLAENQTQIALVANNNRENIKAVSMDEEMADVLKFKFAYTASSKAFNIVDQMIQTIVEKVGLVGK